MARKPPARPTTLGEAVARLARSRRDEDAWQTLYELLWPFAMALNYRVLGGLQDLAEDASQDALIRLARYCPFERLTNVEAFRAYVRTVCRNVSFTYLRRLKDRHETDLDEVPREQAVATGATHEADERMLLRELFGSALDDLDSEDARLLALLASGLSPHEIARIAGISRENTYVRIHRLRRRLGKMLRMNELGLSQPVPPQGL